MVRKRGAEKNFGDQVVRKRGVESISAPTWLREYALKEVLVNSRIGKEVAEKMRRRKEEGGSSERSRRSRR